MHRAEALAKLIKEQENKVDILEGEIKFRQEQSQRYLEEVEERKETIVAINAILEGLRSI